MRTPRKEAGEKRRVPKPTPPEEVPKATSVKGILKNKEKEVEKDLRAVVSDVSDDERPIQKQTDPLRSARIIVEDDSDEEEPTVPFKKLNKVRSESPSREKVEKVLIPRPGERAYKLVSKFDDKKIVKNLVNKTEKSVIEGVTVGELVAMSPEYAKELRKTVSRTRQPVAPQVMLGSIGQSDELPFMDNDSEDNGVRYSSRAIEVGELPAVDSFYIATEEDIGTNPGGIISIDPVMHYLATLSPDESPQPLYSAAESASLRVVFPTINGGERVECVVDSGSQIVSMSLKLAERLGITWDPDLQIYMQSASGQMKKSAGLARNVPFLFGDIPVYLQVHIIDQPAYDVLLGRPFDILTSSNVQNTIGGSQTLTISDPVTNRRCVIPTHARGVFRVAERPRATSEKTTMEKVGRSSSSKENEAREVDFRSSSRS